VRVRWTDQALARLADIEDLVAADDPAAALALVVRLIERGESLAEFPRRGRRVPELPESGLRELVAGNYRLVYRARAGRVEILTVFEGHRLPPWEDLPPTKRGE
jgi:plasmid stabilization system protein ParE